MFPVVATLGYMSTSNLRPIQIRPSEEVVEKIDHLIKKRVASSRAAFGEMSLEFFLPLLEQGKVAVVNGKVQFTSPALAN